MARHRLLVGTGSLRRRGRPRSRPSRSAGPGTRRRAPLVARRVARSGWVETFAGRRADLGWSGRADGRGSSRPADGRSPRIVAGHRRRAPTAAAPGAGARTTSSSYAAADGRLVVVAGRRRRRPGARRPRRPARSRPPCRATARSRFALERATRATSRRRRSTASAWPHGVSTAATSRGTRRGRRRIAARLARVGPPVDAVGRVADRASATRTARPRVVAGGDAVSVGQPRFSPDGDALAFVSDASGWWNVWVADGRRLATRAPVLERGARARGTDVGPGQRSFAWSPDGTRARVVPQRGRLRPAGHRRAPGRAVGARELSKGWHHCARLGRRRHRVRPVRRGDAADGHRARPERTAGASRLARGAPAGIERRRLVEPEPVTWQQRQRDRARPAVPAGRVRARRGTAPPLLVLVHGGPTDQATAGWQPRVAVLRRPRLGGAAPRPPRLDRLRARVRAGARGRWGELDVADTAAGIRHAGEGGLVRPRPGRGDGRQRGRAHRRCSSCAQHGPTRARGRQRCSASPTSSTSPRRRTGSSRATSTGSSARCPTRPTATASARR